MFRKDTLNGSKVTVMTFIVLQLYFNESKTMFAKQYCAITRLFSTLIIIRNVS